MSQFLGMILLIENDYRFIFFWQTGRWREADAEAEAEAGMDRRMHREVR